MDRDNDRCHRCGHDYLDHADPYYFTCFCECPSFVHEDDPEYMAVGTGIVTARQRRYEETGR